jgi:hypothetical protein
MAWAAGQSVTTGSIAANLGYLFVFGAADSGKNLVTGTSYSATLSGSAAYGSDAIGTYVGNTSGGLLTLGTDVINAIFPNADYSWFITFSREATPTSFSAPFVWADTSGVKSHAVQGDGSTTVQRIYSNGLYNTGSLNLGSITASTEYSVVFVRTGSTGKIFYKSGGSAVSISGVSGAFASNIGNLLISGWANQSGGEWYPGRFRAFGRWSRALSDAEAQSMADNPQQIITPAVTYTYARPTSDVTTQWTPSAGTDHYALIDETTANDADYIYATAAGQTDEVRLASMTAPQAGSDVLVNYRVQNVVGTSKVTVSLICNAAVIATDVTRNGPGDYTLTVPATTWATVADWSNMRLRFVSS